MRIKRIIEPVPTDAKLIQLTKGKAAIVDAHRFDELNKYYWRAKKSMASFYACRRTVKNGKTWYVFMHRQVAKTPPGWICHHNNHNSLDNRECNLTNATKADHSAHHKFNSVLIKRESIEVQQP